MKIAVLGNSHIAALKQGWTALAARCEGVDITFFGQQRDGLKNLELSEGRLVATNPVLLESLRFTSGGHSFIELAAYDIILLHGMALMGHAIAPRQHFSRKALKAAFQEGVKDQLSYKLLMLIRSATDKRIYLGHEPLKADIRRKGGQATRGYEAWIAAANREFYEPLNAEFLSQPLKTVVNGSATNMTYSKGSKRLATQEGMGEPAHPPKDLRHMNDEFGRLWMMKFLNGRGIGTWTEAELALLD
ncbi:hypothetical protein [Methylobrevis pamukkalensis]|uniref:Uncharacterized protein n=1 Tax=Methylobrevis pamukkalensis TaxID=1439726 RepID=A0A1E3GWS1_9HYPH|nr:hypothetical protein [Methylobrevis pamukkalensis]ODN68502.1 hypothetical protein A6302_04204 [Methylobrevis pamukkalensis]